MPFEKKEIRKLLKLTIKTLVFQEVRLLQLEQASSPSFMMEEMARSIQEAKRQVMELVRWIPPKERNVLIKKVVRQSIDEEIDQAIGARQNKCFRCIHVRYFDAEGFPHVKFPIQKGPARVMGCEIASRSSKAPCKEFVESPTATSLGEYLMDMAFFYEVKEMFDQFEEIWTDYLTK